MKFEKMMQRSIKQGIALWLCLVMVLMLLMQRVHAADTDGFTGVSSLKICFEYSGEPIEGGTFRIYRVASMNADGKFTLEGDFVDAAVDMKQESRDDWDILASTLKGMAQANDWKETYTVVTGKDGRTVVEGMGNGLYLVCGEKCVQKGYTYWSVPALVAVPGINGDQTWNHEVVMYPKVDRTANPIDPREETVSRRVLKTWIDSGEIDKRPEYIEIDLLCDGKVYTTTKLTAAMNWRHEWTDLPKYDDKGSLIQWTVSERITGNYTVKIATVETTFVVANTDTEVKGQPPYDPPVLPNTGLLWWPVSVLCAAGLICLIIGIWRRKSE